MLFYFGFSQGCEKNARCFWVSDGIRPKGQTLFYCRMASDVINEGLILFLSSHSFGTIILGSIKICFVALSLCRFLKNLLWHSGTLGTLRYFAIFQSFTSFYIVQKSATVPKRHSDIASFQYFLGPSFTSASP